MNANKKIVAINPSSTDRPVADISLRKALIKKINAYGVKFLKLRTGTLFNNVDEYFFDRSGQSLAGLDSRVVFDAMRELRMKRDTVDAHMRNSITQQFRCLCTNEYHSPEPDKENQTLAIVDDVNLEKTVSINNIITSARSRNSRELLILTHGLQNLLDTNELKEKANPIGPDFICNSFLNICKTLDIDLKISLILFKHFERVVIRELPQLYKVLIEVLVEAGIVDSSLPKHGVKSSRRSHLPVENETESETDLPETNLYSILGAIASCNNRMNMPLNKIKQGLNNLEGELSKGDLLQQLSYIGTSYSSQQTIGLVNIIPSLIQNILETKRNNITQPDEDTINLSTMFFDFVLKDKNLPERIRMLISQLQLPVLKMALNDMDFFRQRKHPARRLINMIAKAGFGIAKADESANQGIYEKLESIVDTIRSHQGEIDRKIFTQQAKQLSEFLARDEHRLKLLEKRFTQAAEGKAKLEFSKKTIEALITEQANALEQLGSPIKRFIENEWKQVLLQTLLKEGENTRLWQENKMVLAELIALCRKTLAGADKAAVDVEFEKVKSKILSSLAQASIQSSAKDLVFMNYSLFESAVMMEQDESRESDQNTASSTPILGPEKIEIDQRIFEEDMSIKEEYMIKARALAIGQWVEISSEDDQEILTRCKLIAKIDLVDRFVFIDAVGKKVAELNRKEVALSLQNAKLKILNSEPLVERAIASISSQINGSANDEATVDNMMSNSKVQE
jgi:hypothetical protein